MIAAVGFFDGVHLGHRVILEGADTAITFANHPLSVLDPASAPRLILPLRDKIAAIKSCGVKNVIALDFTPAMAAMAAEDFAKEYLSAHSTVRAGANWRFGKGGEGDAGTLERLGIRAVTVPYATHSGLRISSSRIREELSKGDVETAASMLGRPLSFTAGVKRGKGIGAKIGYPTVNLDFGGFTPCLANGVYAVKLNGKPGVSNFGFAPTMGEKAWPSPEMEVNLAEPPGMTAGDSVRIEMLRFIRPEMRFDSIDALKERIAKDREVAFG
ncbi:MAG: hypothetical protein J6W80_01590 [Kiritimatiellae bacterium]|nr:hypothetical protein [Kiritimatiellia bacterium]